MVIILRNHVFSKNQFNDSCEWLKATSIELKEPLLQYLTYLNLDDNTEPTSELLNEVKNTKFVFKWVKYASEALRNLTKSKLSINDIHGSKPYLLENVIYKFDQIGLLDMFKSMYTETKNKKMNWMQKENKEFWEMLNYNLFFKYLSGVGWASDNVSDYIKNRINNLHKIAITNEFDLYRNKLSNVPKKFQEMPVKRKWISGGEILQPQLYDILIFSNMYRNYKDKIDQIVNYIMNLEYQQFNRGFGYGEYAKGKWYAIGYSIHLAGYDPKTQGFTRTLLDGKNGKFKKKTFLQYMDYFSKFKPFQQSRYFKEALSYLLEFKTDNKFYLPPEFIGDSSSGYFVHGAYKGLLNNRRSKEARIAESTYWILKIIKPIL